MFTYLAELVDCTKTRKNNRIRNLDMACKGGAICHYNIVAHNTVMSDMGISHDKVIVSYPCDALAVYGPPVHSHVFFYDVVVAHAEACILFFIRNILWRPSKGCKGANRTVFPNLSSPLNYYVRKQLGFFFYNYISFNDAVRSYFNR